MYAIYRVENQNNMVARIKVDPFPESRVLAEKLARYVASLDVPFYDSGCKVFLEDIKEI